MNIETIYIFSVLIVLLIITGTTTLIIYKKMQENKEIQYLKNKTNEEITNFKINKIENKLKTINIKLTIILIIQIIPILIFLIKIKTILEILNKIIL